MRRIALFGLLLLLPACEGPGDYIGNPFAGFGGFMGDTVSFHEDPNQPVINSENMRRAAGQQPATQPLLPDAGDIWPGPSKPDPTLSDIEKQQQQQQEEQAPAPATPPRPMPRGSSTPPGSVQPQYVRPQPAPATTLHPAPPVTTTALPSGSVLQTPKGAAVITNGGNGVQTYTLPDGSTGQAINNGNGTVTLIGPNGATQSVPAPRR